MRKKWTCDVCGFIGFKLVLLRHKETVHDGVLHRCKICDVPIRSITNVGDHMKRMHGNEEFSCDQCNFKTKTKRRLKVHIGIKHGEKKFECKLCESKYGFQFGLTRHIKMVHANTLPESERDIAACPFCDFKSKSWNVKKHLRQMHRKKENSETKQKNHKCEYCDKLYLNKESLWHHLFRYHRSKLNAENFQRKQCWSCPDCEFISDVVYRN